jgi:hypothetical protein
MTSDISRPPLPDPSGLEDTLSPVDLPGDVPGEGAPLRWAVTIVAVASALLLFLNATSIRAWANELPPGPATDPVIAAADAWYGFTSSLGLAAPVETVHLWWEGARAARFGSQPDTAPADAPARQPRPGEERGEPTV